MTRLLDGVRVVDIADERAEFAGRLLADLGAEVIKIEPPGGTAARRLPPFEAGGRGDPEGSLYWAAYGVGKRSVVLDLGVGADRQSLLGLLGGADIFVESFAPGYLDGLGLGYEQVRALNPALTYVSVTPYGQTGPDAHSPATDLTLEAAGGLVGLQGDGDRPPIPIGFPQAYLHAGAQAAADAVVALNERARSGLGQHLDVSAQAAVVWTLMNATGFPPNTGGDQAGTGAQRAGPQPQVVPGVDLPAAWEVADGWVMGSISGGGRGAAAMPSLLRWVEEAGQLPAALAGRSAGNLVLDVQQGRAPASDFQLAVDTLKEFFRGRTKLEVYERAVRDGFLFAPVNTVADVLADPQLAAREYWVELGGRTHPGRMAMVSGVELSPDQPAPTLGSDQALVGSSHAPKSPSASAGQRSRPFEGLKVLDFSWVGVGPMIAKALADHGATVVHVESAARPDALRLAPPFKDGQPGLDRSQFFANFNSSKLGLALDLGNPVAGELARKLAGWADIVLESFTPGALDRLGLGYGTLSAGRDDLIMLSTCLNGQTGPFASYGGFGLQGAAIAGIHGLTGWPDRPPKGPWGAYTDFINPRIGLAVMGSAILRRRETGRGCYIDLAQVEAGIHFIEPLVLDYTVNGKVAAACGLESDRACPHGVYSTQGQERYVAVACETAEQWRALKTVVPLGAAFDDPTLDDLHERLPHDAAIDAAVGAWLAEREPFAAVATLKAAGVPAAVVQRPSDLYADAQLAHRGFFVTCDHTVMGPTPYDGPVTIYSATPPQMSAAPCVGEHTEYVLREMAGLSADEIAEAAAAGAFG